jgi:hypothetical protein
MSKFHQYVREALDIQERAEQEGRWMTPSEYAEIRVLQDKAEKVKANLDPPLSRPK